MLCQPKGRQGEQVVCPGVPRGRAHAEAGVYIDWQEALSEGKRNKETCVRVLTHVLTHSLAVGNG